MKTVILIESCYELVELFRQHRSHGDTSPVAPEKAKVQIGFRMSDLVRLENFDGFELREIITTKEFVELLSTCGHEVRISVLTEAESLILWSL